MSLDSIQNLLVSEMRDLYSAEKQLVDALPAMAKAASNEDLKQAFRDHLEETVHHVERLEQAFGLIQEPPTEKHCKAMAGLIAEAEDRIKEEGRPEVKDAALIAAAQRAEHYEISGYGTVSTYADELDLDEVADLLEETLSEEKAADKRLTKIATGGWIKAGVNRRANQ